MVKRSRFLCEVHRVESQEDARAFIASVRLKHFDARHHCTAMLIGPRAELRRSNDDGEPTGTAGRPMTEVIAGRGISDVVAVVTRWFGGTLLGTGGLIRAYSDAVGAALDAAGTRDRLLLQLAEVTVPVALGGVFEHRLRQLGDVIDVDYGGEVRFTVATGSLDQLVAEIAEASGGKATVRARGTRWQDV